MQCSYNVFAINWFLNKVVGTTTKGPYSKIVLTMAGDQQCRCLWLQFLYLFQQRQSIHSGHLDIAHDGIVIMFLDLFERIQSRVTCIYLYFDYPQEKRLGKGL